jgi:hypothetical protein
MAAARPGDHPIVPFGSFPDPGKLDYCASLGIGEVVLRCRRRLRRRLPVLDDYAAGGA